MLETISMSLKKYFDFKGRATRKEYWTFYAFTIIAAIAFGVIEGLTGIKGLSNLAIVALIIPNISCGVRRMHDVGKSGWYIIAPLANILYLLSSSVPEADKNQNNTITSS